MDRNQIALQLIEFIPNIEERHQERSRKALEDWAKGGKACRDLNMLLASWSSVGQIARLAPSQHAAMLSVIVWSVESAADDLAQPDVLLLQAVSNVAQVLPWTEESFTSKLLVVITRTADQLPHGRSNQIRQAVHRLMSFPGVPKPVADSLRSIHEQLPSAPAQRHDREVSISAGSPFRLMGPVPVGGRDLLMAACEALESLRELLDSRQSISNQHSIDNARRATTADPGSNIVFLCHLIFLNLDKRVDGDPFRIKPGHVTPLYILAAFLETRALLNSAVARDAAPFRFWFKLLTDVDNNNISPRAGIDRMRRSSRSGSSGRFDEERRNFIRFGNRYLDTLARRKELDPNTLVEWLEAYKLIAYKSPGIFDPTLFELVSSAILLARDYGAEARVGALIDMLDPAKAKHPWTSPMVFPAFSSQECELLLAGMRAMQVPEVHKFLTRTDVIRRLKEQLVKMLVGDEHSRYKPPARGVADMPLDEARRDYERCLGTKRSGYHEACETYAYLLARSGDVGMAQPLWVETPKDVRSHEERWNLAVFALTVGDPRSAFDELWERVRVGEAPYEHLRFVSSLALALEGTAEGSGVPVAEVLRLLPIAAAHAYAYAVAPPAEPRVTPAIIKDIRTLADEPFEAKLHLYRNPRSQKRESRDDTLKEIEFLKTSLLVLKLKTTWRLWLTGYANRFPRTGMLWEKLYETWSNDDPKVAKEKLETALHFLGGAETYGDKYELLLFLKTYIQRLTPEELDQRRGKLQAIARSSKYIIRDEDPRTFEKLWQEDRVSRTSDPWTSIERLLIREFDEPALTQLVNAGFSQLKGLAPDVHSIDLWQKTYQQLLSILRAGRAGRSDLKEISALNDWLAQHPASSCDGLLAKVRPLAEWIHKIFPEKVKQYKLAPIPKIERLVNDPGVPLSLPECSCVVELSAPAGTALKDVRVHVAKSDAFRRSGDSPVLSHLPGGYKISISVPFSLGPEHLNDTPLLIRFTGTYGWGVVGGIPFAGELTYSRYDYSSYLEGFGIKQDMLPGNIFMFDRPIEIHELSRAFVGREQEVAFIKNVFSETQKLPGTPIYIHGIRKVGKTSLLHRCQLDDVLPSSAYVSLYVSLFGLTKDTPLAGQCMRMRREILDSLSASGITAETEAPPIIEGEGYKVLESWEQFMVWLRQIVEPKQVVLLLDEFHNICVPQAAPLLDLIRSLYQRRHILFILAGWVDHEVLRINCPSSQLFPLEQRSISFLSEMEVCKLVEGQFAIYGVKVGSNVLAHLIKLTEGHPNLVQRICGLVLDELNRFRRPVMTVTDVDRPAAKIVEDGSQFTNSQLNSWVVSPEERKALNEIINLSPSEGAWVQLDKVPPEIKSTYVFPLIKKDVLTRDPSSGHIRIRGLLFEKYLRSVRGITPDDEVPGKPNVAFVLDSENTLSVCPAGANPADVAQVLRSYVETLGNPRVCIIAANWITNPNRVQLKAAFVAHKFAIMDSYRNDDKNRQRGKNTDKNLADFVIYREVYNRLMEERDNANDTIDIYVICAGDGGYKDLVIDLVQKHHKKVRLLARKEHRYLSPEYFPYEDIRKKVSQMPGEDPIPSFIMDDLTPLIAHLGPLPIV